MLNQQRNILLNHCNRETTGQKLKNFYIKSTREGNSNHLGLYHKLRLFED